MKQVLFSIELTQHEPYRAGSIANCSQTIPKRTTPKSPPLLVLSFCNVSLLLRLNFVRNFAYSCQPCFSMTTKFKITFTKQVAKVTLPFNINKLRVFVVNKFCKLSGVEPGADAFSDWILLFGS